MERRFKLEIGSSELLSRKRLLWCGVWTVREISSGLLDGVGGLEFGGGGEFARARLSEFAVFF